MKMLNKISKILFVAFATLLCVLLAGYDVAMANSAVINNALNAKTYEIKTVDSDGTFNSEYYTFDYSTKEEVATASKALCKRVEAEGLVMLTNNGALPLASNSKISFFAQGSVTPNYGSTGSSAGSTKGYGSLKDAFEAEGFSVNETLWNWYASRQNVRSTSVSGLVKTYKMNESSWADVKTANESSFGTFGDAAIVTLSRDSGEGNDVSTMGSDGKNGSYLSVTQEEEDLLKGLTELKNAGTIKKIIVLHNSAVPMETAYLFDEDISVDAALWIGNFGMTGAEGVASVISGKANPSGHLTDTFCKDAFSSPAMASWKRNKNGIFAQEYTNATALGLNDTQKYYGVYVEGIYVGYRYYETRYEDYVLGNTTSYDYDADVAFPFGHGKSYTEFSYENFDVTDKGNGTFDVTVTVKNVGSVKGKGVAEIYLQKPFDTSDGVEKASVELVGFAKTNELTAGDSQTLTVTVKKEQFKSYDSKNAKTYILSKGDYYLTVADNAHTAVNNIIMAKGANAEAQARMSGTGNATFAKKVLSVSSTDTTTFAKAVETGKTITNLFDFADVNRYENKGDNAVTYVSRSDWSGTFPTASVSMSVGESMKADLDSHKPLPENDGLTSPEYNVPHGRGLVNMRGLAYDHAEWEVLLDQMTFEEQALLVSNAAFGTVAIESISLVGTKASDGPNGVVGSITATSFPSEGIWASSFDTAIVQSVGDMLAEDAKINGVDTMYAPGINIHRTPFGGRAHEYFSEDSFLTAMCACAEVKGLQSKGVVSVLKHYAFNDEESARNGICVWLNEQSAREIYLLPFEYAMRPSIGGAVGAMSSFNRVGAKWTGACRELQIDICRNEWNYAGYFLTDMASSNGALFMTFDDGIMGGTDLFLGSGSKTALKSWKNSFAFRQRVRECAHRVLYVVANYSMVMNGLTPDSIIIPIMPWWQVLIIVFIILSAVVSVASLVAFVVTTVWKK